MQADMPKIVPDEDITKLASCVLYLAKRKGSNNLHTVMRLDKEVVVFNPNGVQYISGPIEPYFYDTFQIIRKYQAGEKLILTETD